MWILMPLKSVHILASSVICLPRATTKVTGDMSSTKSEYHRTDASKALESLEDMLRSPASGTAMFILCAWPKRREQLCI